MPVPGATERQRRITGGTALRQVQIVTKGWRTLVGPCELANVDRYLGSVVGLDELRFARTD